MAYRFEHVKLVLATRGINLAPLPVVINVDDQIDLLRSPAALGNPNQYADFIRLHGWERNEHRLANNADYLACLSLTRAFVPEVLRSSTGWLSAPIWPQILTPGEVRARDDRRAAVADGNTDHATANALAVRRSLTSRAALMHINEMGARGYRQMQDHLPHDLVARDNLPAIIEEIRELCGLFELLDKLRRRCEARAAAVGLGFPRDGYRFWRLAALDMFALGEYIAKYVPFYEVLTMQDEEDADPWPTTRRVDPKMEDVEKEDGEDCPLCWGGNEDCKMMRLNCGHRFGKACFMRWMAELDAQDLPRTCPMCRRLPASSGACYSCGLYGHEAQLRELRGGCTCPVLYCWNCIPSLSAPAPCCGQYFRAV
jgi:hypothetical protein